MTNHTEAATTTTSRMAKEGQMSVSQQHCPSSNTDVVISHSPTTTKAARVTGSTTTTTSVAKATTTTSIATKRSSSSQRIDKHKQRNHGQKKLSRYHTNSNQQEKEQEESNANDKKGMGQNKKQLGLQKNQKKQFQNASSSKTKLQQSSAAQANICPNLSKESDNMSQPESANPDSGEHKGQDLNQDHTTKRTRYKRNYRNSRQQKHMSTPSRKEDLKANNNQPESSQTSDTKSDCIELTSTLTEHNAVQDNGPQERKKRPVEKHAHGKENFKENFSTVNTEEVIAFAKLRTDDANINEPPQITSNLVSECRDHGDHDTLPSIAVSQDPTQQVLDTPKAVSQNKDATLSLQSSPVFVSQKEHTQKQHRRPKQEPSSSNKQHLAPGQQPDLPRNALTDSGVSTSLEFANFDDEIPLDAKAFFRNLPKFPEQTLPNILYKRVRALNKRKTRSQRLEDAMKQNSSLKLDKDQQELLARKPEVEGRLAALEYISPSVQDAAKQLQEFEASLHKALEDSYHKQLYTISQQVSNLLTVIVNIFAGDIQNDSHEELKALIAAMTQPDDAGAQSVYNYLISSPDTIPSQEANSSQPGNDSIAAMMQSDKSYALLKRQVLAFCHQRNNDKLHASFSTASTVSSTSMSSSVAEAVNYSEVSPENDSNYIRKSSTLKCNNLPSTNDANITSETHRLTGEGQVSLLDMNTCPESTIKHTNNDAASQKSTHERVEATQMGNKVVVFARHSSITSLDNVFIGDMDEPPIVMEESVSSSKAEEAHEFQSLPAHQNNGNVRIQTSTQTLKQGASREHPASDDLTNGAKEIKNLVMADHLTESKNQPTHAQKSPETIEVRGIMTAKAENSETVLSRQTNKTDKTPALLMAQFNGNIGEGREVHGKSQLNQTEEQIIEISLDRTSQATILAERDRARDVGGFPHQKRQYIPNHHQSFPFPNLQHQHQLFPVPGYGISHPMPFMVNQMMMPYPTWPAHMPSPAFIPSDSSATDRAPLDPNFPSISQPTSELIVPENNLIGRSHVLQHQYTSLHQSPPELHGYSSPISQLPQAASHMVPLSLPPQHSVHPPKIKTEL